MNPKEADLAQSILEALDDHPTYINSDHALRLLLSQRGVRDFPTTKLLHHLQEEGLVHVEHPGPNRPEILFKITAHGTHVRSMGLRKYLELKRTGPELEAKAKVATVNAARWAKWALGVSILALLFSIASFFLSRA